MNALRRLAFIATSLGLLAALPSGLLLLAWSLFWFGGPNWILVGAVCHWLCWSPYLLYAVAALGRTQRGVWPRLTLRLLPCMLLATLPWSLGFALYPFAGPHPLQLLLGMLLGVWACAWAWWGAPGPFQTQRRICAGVLVLVSTGTIGSYALLEPDPQNCLPPHLVHRQRAFLDPVGQTHTVAGLQATRHAAERTARCLELQPGPPQSTFRVHAPEEPRWGQSDAALEAFWHTETGDWESGCATTLAWFGDGALELAYGCSWL